MRINKFLAYSGVASRRTADKMIEDYSKKADEIFNAVTARLR